MKQVSHKKAYVRNPDTGGFEPLMAIRGESAYEIAVRLGKFTGTEEEWNAIEKEYANIPTTATIHFNYVPESE